MGVREEGEGGGRGGCGMASEDAAPPPHGTWNGGCGGGPPERQGEAPPTHP